MTDTDVKNTVTRTRTRASTLLITITIIALRKRKNRLPREEGASDYVDIELIYRHLEKVFSTSLLMNKRDIKRTVNDSPEIRGSCTPPAAPVEPSVSPKTPLSASWFSSWVACPRRRHLRSSGSPRSL